MQHEAIKLCESERVKKVDGDISNRRTNIFLYFSALSVNLSTFGVGCAFAWSSPAIPRLNGNVDPSNNPLATKITSQEEAWIASLFPLGAAVTCFISGYLADRIGRKRTLLLSSAPMISGFLVEAFATKFWHFYLGRILNGFCAGAVFMVVPMYVGEIAENFNRGVLGCFFVVFLTSGMLFTYTIGPYVTIKLLSLCNIIGPVVFVLTFGCLIPESPYYLIARNRKEMARKSLMKLRRDDIDVVDTQLPVIRDNVEKSFANKRGIKDVFTKTLGITGCLVLFQQLTGINLIIFYMESIFEESGSSMSSGISTIIVGIVRVLSSFASSSLVDKLGRRILLLTSATGMTLSYIGFATYFHLKNGGHNVEILYWLPVLSVVFYIFSFAFGYGSVPFAMIGEVFPPHVKSAAITLTIFVCFVLMFCVTTFFPYLIEFIGMAHTLSLLAFLCTSGGVFVYFCVPETKGKSLQEIQEMLK